jgi:hypothetical protein
MAMFFIMLGWLMMFAAVLIWALQGFAWLYYDQWITISLLDLWRMLDFEAPKFAWKGLEKAVLWFMELSPGQGLMLFGLTLSVGVNLLADQSEKAILRSKQKHDDDRRRKAKAELAKPTRRSPLETDPS